MPTISDDFTASSPIIKIPNLAKPVFRSNSKLNQTQIDNDSQTFAELIVNNSTTVELTKFLDNHIINVNYRYYTKNDSSRSLFYLAAVHANSPEIVQYLLNLGANISENAVFELMRYTPSQLQSTKCLDILKIIANVSHDVNIIHHLQQFEHKMISIYNKLYLNLADNIIKNKNLNFKDFNQIPLENFDPQLLNESLLKGLKKLNLLHNNIALKTLKETIDDIVPGKNLLLYSVQQTLANCVKKEIILNTVVNNDNFNHIKLFEKLESIAIGTVHGISTYSFKIYEQLLANDQVVNAGLLFDKKTINFYNTHPQYKILGNFLKTMSEEQFQKVFDKGYYEELKKLLYINALDLKTQDKIINALYEYELIQHNKFNMPISLSTSQDSNASSIHQSTLNHLKIEKNKNSDDEDTECDIDSSEVLPVEDNNNVNPVSGETASWYSGFN